MGWSNPGWVMQYYLTVKGEDETLLSTQPQARGVDLKQ